MSFSMPSPPPVSAIMITLNSARILPDVLGALTWCDEIVVVDSGSTDETLAIARQFGGRTLHRDFDGFGLQKGFAVSQARNHWVLVVDADEIVTDELRSEIQLRLTEVETGQLNFRGFEVPISLVFLDRLMRYGGEYKMPHLRLFDKRFGNYNTARVHEDVVLNGAVGKLTHHMLHNSYGSLHEYFEKFNRYTTAGARDLVSQNQGHRGSVAQIVFRLPITFLKEYIVKRNFLNGYPGFIWSLFSAMYPVVKYAKLRELRSKRRAKQTTQDRRATPL